MSFPGRLKNISVILPIGKGPSQKIDAGCQTGKSRCGKKTKATPAKAAVKTPVKKTGASALPAARPIPKPAPVSKTEEILDQQDLSLDIVDDALVEQAAEKPVDPAVSQRKVQRPGENR